MNCPVCGKSIKDEAIFCVYCGSKIPRCPTCGKVFDKPVRFCGNDGTPLPEEMFAVLKQKKNVDAIAEEQLHNQPTIQPRQSAAEAIQLSTATQETARPMENVSADGKKKRPVVLILLVILLLFMVGVGMVIGICFPDKLKDMLPNSLVEVLMSDDDENAEEEIETEELQQEADDVGAVSGTMNDELEETTEGSPMSATASQKESTLDEAATENDVTKEIAVDEIEEASVEETDSFEDTSKEEETVAEEEELDKVLIFILNSDCYYFTEEYIADFDADMCRLARNGIYAKMGRKFNDASLTEYFSQYDWYEPTIEASSFSESMLNDYQIANRDLIVAFEAAQGYR